MDPLSSNIFSFLISPPMEGWFLIAKIVFIVLSFLLFVFIIFGLLNTGWARLFIVQDMAEFMTFRPYGVRRIEKNWRRIRDRLNSGMETEYKLAISDADGLLDDILKRMGYAGGNLEERLGKLTEVSLPNIEEIKQSHQTRNTIIRDPDYRLSLDEARKTLDVYEKALRDLQAF